MTAMFAGPLSLRLRAAKGLAEYHEFPGLKAFGRIEATRVIDGRTETDVRIFVLSRKLSPQALLET